MSARLPNLLAHLLLLVLVIQAGWFGGQWTWRVIWPQSIAAGMARTAPEPGSGVARIRPDELTFFGQVEGREGDIPDVVRETAPETGLTLKLHGVFLGTQAQASSAILSEDGASAELYQVGDELPGNAELIAVEPRRILLKRNGEVESLGFEDEGMALGRVASSGQRSEDSEAFLEQASDALENNPEEAIASAGFRPREDGPGYVYDGTNERLSDMNLQPGDVIISINGRELGNVEEDRERLEQWMSSGTLQLEIERGGTRFSFTVPVP
ncbi:type II secretion system protein C (GspC) [Halospina denitrificans]|uniref:Type II secretion system protein C (GspC) n=1 Tax=Halospina denitrificans TaxID=332522 RepID=A0A4R7JYA8_9GAMM|nr:type II secretion system protein N [Halospina denitrificans]TDT43165.1 type II secretion system protein C (GspC) [Halospina denitrificans]